MPSAGAWVVLLTATVLLAACGAPHPLPPEQRYTRSSAMQPLPRPEAYRVVRGDTLYSIAFRYGLDWREVARWNNIGAPYTIRVDQWVRLMPPPAMQSAVARPETRTRTRQPQARHRETVSAPTESLPVKPPERPAVEHPSGTSPAEGADESNRSESESPSRPERRPSPAAPAEPAAEAETAASSSVEKPGSTRSVAGVAWSWPSEGRIMRGFDASATRKGILIGGRRGQPVRAAAAGEVVYSGAGLIGYGELIIIKHSDRMLSAYGHNRERLVREGDRVVAGQLIARMGRNEGDQEVLHFEIRRDGRPENPVNFLPAR